MSPAGGMVEYVEHFRARVLQDALTEATAAYWLRRARQFEAARPRPGDYHGAATVDELRDGWRRLTGVAQACRNRAAVCQLTYDIDPDVWAALREAE